MLKNENKEPLKAFILAAGYGTRLRSVTGKKPKPLVPFMNQPTLFHILDQIKKAGLKKICINLHYEAETLKKAIKLYEKEGLEILLSQEKELLGTGGALSAKKVRLWRGSSDLFVINSDIIHSFDLKKLILAHKKEKALVTLAVNKIPKVKKTILWCEKGFLRSFSKKEGNTETPHSFACMHLLSDKILSQLPQEKNFSIISVYEKLLKRGESIHVVPFSEFWEDIGDPDTYKKCHLKLLKLMKEGKKINHPAFQNTQESMRATEKILSTLSRKEGLN